MILPTRRLRAEVDRLEAELAKAKKDLHEAKVAQTGFAEGEVVEARKYSKGWDWRPAIIRQIFMDWKDRPHYTVSFTKKDGGWSKVPVRDVEVRKAPILLP